MTHENKGFEHFYWVFTLEHNGNTYEYYLARNADNGYFNIEFDIEVVYVSTDLPEGKMDISVYGGFTFEQFSDANYKAFTTTFCN